MADVAVNIPVSSIEYITWLRSSVIGTSMISDAGTPMIEQIELGIDQGDSFINILDEAAREVAKVFISRQGDVQGIPFEYDGNNAIYRFNEYEPTLKQSEAIKNVLNEDVKNALYAYVSFIWFRLKGYDDKSSYLMNKYQKLTIDIQGNLHKLHD